MLRATERWQHSSYWITSPFSPSNVLITSTFAVTWVFTFYGKMQLFTVCMKCKRTDFPNTVKTKVVTQPLSQATRWFRNLQPQLLLAQANASLRSALVAPVCVSNCFGSSLTKLKKTLLSKTYYSLYIAFKHLVYILSRHKYCAAQGNTTAFTSKSSTRPKQGHSLYVTLQQTTFTDFHHCKFINL